MFKLLAIWLATLSADTLQDEREANSYPELNGIWAVKSAESLGVPVDYWANTTIEISGSECTWTREGRELKRYFKINSATDPMHLDQYGTEEREGTFFIPAIFKIENDELYYCRSDIDKPRPETFSASEVDRNTYLIVFRRVMK